jgi:hypothetical protein
LSAAVFDEACPSIAVLVVSSVLTAIHPHFE